jgi:ribonuclease HIII
VEKQPELKNALRPGRQYNFQPTLELEKAAACRGFKKIAGVDEAGRGPLAGPVVAAAVILGDRWNDNHPLNDSKRLSAKNREQLFDVISFETILVAKASELITSNNCSRFLAERRFESLSG